MEEPVSRFQVWVPVTPARGNVSLELWDGAKNIACFTLTPAEARSLGARLIGAGAVLKERRTQKATK